MKIKAILFLLVSIFLFQYVTIYAQDDVKSENLIAEFAYGSLKAIDDKFMADLEDTDVTRGEFVKNIVNLSGITTFNIEGVGFSDVTADSPYFNEVSTALGLNWISDSDMFYPDNNITLEQALKIGVHAIGGGDHATYYGGWPEGYWTVASKNGFLDNISLTKIDALTSEQMCILLYNIMTASSYSIEVSDSNVSYINPDDVSLLEKVHNMYIDEGVLTANSITDMGDELTQPKNTVRIGADDYYDEFGCEDYLGYNVKIVYEYVDGDKVIRYALAYNNEVIEFNNHNVVDADDKYLYYLDEENKDAKIKLEDGFKYIYNGKTKLITDPELVNIFTTASTNFTLIDNDKNGSFEVVRAEQYTYTYVDSFDLYKGIIYDMYSNDSLIDLSAADCKYDVYVWENGQLFDGTLDDLDKEIIVATTSSDDGKYKKVILCFDSLMGSIDNINVAEKKATIDSEEYYISDYYLGKFNYQLGSDRVFYLGINNEIVADSASGGDMKYGWFIKARPTDDFEEQYKAKLFTQDGKMEQLILAENVYVDSVRSSALVAYDELRDVETRNLDKERLIKFGVNKDGKINRIDFAEQKLDNLQAIGQNYPERDGLIMNFTGRFVPRGGYLLRDSATQKSKFNIRYTQYIFLIPLPDARNDDERYRLATVNEISRGGEQQISTMYAYDTQLSGSPKAITITDGSFLGGVGGTTQYGVVEKITSELDNKELAAKAIYVSDGTTYSKIYVSPSFEATITMPNPGDIIEYICDSYESATLLNKLFDFKTYQIMTDTEEQANTAFNAGMLYTYNNGYMFYHAADMTNPYKPRVPATIDPTTVRNTNVSADKIVFINAVRSTDGEIIKKVSINPAPLTNLFGSRTSSGDRVTFVVNKLYYTEGSMTFAYNIEYK